jgi:hypothetical protein
MSSKTDKFLAVGYIGRICLMVICFMMAGNLKGQSVVVRFSSSPDAFGVEFGGYRPLPLIAIDTADDVVVRLAASFFAQDVERVTGRKPQVDSMGGKATEMIIAGTIGRSRLIDRMIAAGKLADIEKIKGRWEASLWQIVLNPMPGVRKALVIAGSDRRGTAYGFMALSKKIGISPWYWWADVPVVHRNAVTISVSKPAWDEPAVRYRGIFINDEDWGINEWARHTFEKDFGSGIGPKTYEKVFELMLRLRLNYIWPAMHEVSKEFGNTPENVALADRYGIVAGSSHCEPMLYNNVHWNESKKGRWNYSTNRDTIYDTWKETVAARNDKEAVWTLGIRGIHDRGMETPPAGTAERIDLLERVFRDQRGLIDNYVTRRYGSPAECFVPYKEVLPVYDAGLKVPDDVTLMWVDDNFGYIRRLSNPAERTRQGGSGLYWHLSYYGAPHSYTWINTTAPALMWEEFEKAWVNQARTIWVINVGDIKPMELGIDYFSRLSWNPAGQKADAQPLFLRSFLTEQFGAGLQTSLHTLLTEFYRLGTIRKPELMNRNWSLSLSRQRAAALASAYEGLLKREAAVFAKVPAAKRDAYTELIGFPVRILAATGLIFMRDRESVLGNDQTKQIDRLKSFIEGQVAYYNDSVAKGKWRFMMPGMVTGKNLPAWSSQVAWPWGETRAPDTSKQEVGPDFAVPASSFTAQAKATKVKWTAVSGLGPSGSAVALEPAGLDAAWAVGDTSAPTMKYTFTTDGRGGKAIFYFMPTFRIYPGMLLRVTVGVDGDTITTLEVPGSSGKEDENGPNRNEGIRNNCVSAIVELPDLPAGKHELFIRAVDPGVVIDRIGFIKK